MVVNGGKSVVRGGAAVADGGEAKVGGEVGVLDDESPPDAATTFTESFIPPPQWPGTPHMK